MIGAVEFAVIAGYGLSGIFFGLWVGERRARIFIENMSVHGRSAGMERATVYAPDDPEDRMEKDIDEATKEQRRVRVVSNDQAPIEHDPKTIENGIEYLLEEARSRGEQISRDEAEDEVIRMLNAEGPEMA